MASQQNSSKSEEAESNAQIIRLMERVEGISQKTNDRVHNNIVAFVGPTKAGKSTFINCLLGTKLICKMNEKTEETFIIKVDDKAGPKIGGSGESETETPECWGNMAGTNYEIWDFPGFGDNKGTEQEIVNAISYQTILLAAESVCFVLVVPCSMIKDDDPLPFYKLLNEIHNICPEVADSLCIVFTKFDKGNIKKLLEDAKDKIFSKTDQTNMDIINQSKKIIGNILKKKNYMDFKYPKIEEEEEDKIFILPNKQQFIECISKLRGTKVKDFPLVISYQAKHVIAELYTVFYQTVKKEVENMNTLIEKYIQTKINEILDAKEEDGKPTSAASRLANFKIGKNTIQEIIEESKNFKLFFAEINKLGLGNNGILESIEKFAFIETLRNMYKMDDIELSLQGELEFFSNVKVALNSGIKIYSDLIGASAAATEEEKRMEKEWEKIHNDKVNILEKEIEKINRNNNSALVQLNQRLMEMTTMHAYEMQNMKSESEKLRTFLDTVKRERDTELENKNYMANKLKETEVLLNSERNKAEDRREEKMREAERRGEERREEKRREREEKKREEERREEERKEEKKKIAEDKNITEKRLNELQKILEEKEKSKRGCQISLVKDIDYNNPLLNKPLLLKSFSDLYGTKALSYLISLTEVLSEDSSESLQEICGSPHALEMFATMIGLSRAS